MIYGFLNFYGIFYKHKYLAALLHHKYITDDDIIKIIESMKIDIEEEFYDSVPKEFYDNILTNVPNHLLTKKMSLPMRTLCKIHNLLLKKECGKTDKNTLFYILSRGQFVKQSIKQIAMADSFPSHVLKKISKYLCFGNDSVKLYKRFNRLFTKHKSKFDESMRREENSLYQDKYLIKETPHHTRRGWQKEYPNEKLLMGHFEDYSFGVFKKDQFKSISEENKNRIDKILSLLRKEFPDDSIEPFYCIYPNGCQCCS